MIASTVLLLSLSELAGVVMAATPDTGINLSPGEYVGYANDVTQGCWPEMATVLVDYAVAPGDTAVFFLDHDQRGALIASGSTKLYNDSAFATFLKPGKCFSVEGEHIYLLTNQRRAAAEQALFCTRNGRLVMFLETRRRGEKISYLSCPVYLAKKGLSWTSNRFAKMGTTLGGKVVVDGYWHDDDGDSGVARLSFHSLDNWAFTRFPYIPIYGSVRPPFACHWFNYEDDLTPDLATAEAIISIYPLRLDNIRLCIARGHWTLHLGEDTDDGVGKKVVIPLRR
ncbi:hypothetical protein FOZ63_028256 [Perkinsus olseni]|uniref:Sorl1p n=1 Tax=Perkinsus olseni TaxID=32597 RepID=A0A7J6QGP4_PEROL|nr:hypothetical protein FOZ63_028256 [Perkinsus olseni]KAF4728872.1 hypothetical protein FOZ62_016256 [Perkinsus olseni]